MNFCMKASTFMVLTMVGCAVQPPTSARLQNSSSENANSRNKSSSDFKDDSSSTFDDSDNKSEKPSLYGQVISETTDTTFKGKQVYGLYIDMQGSKTLMISIIDSEASIDSLLKKVKEAKCVKCPDDKCESSSTSSVIPKAINLTFMGAMAGSPTAQVNADGFPKDLKNVYDQTRLIDGFSLSSTLVSVMEKVTGSATFAAGSLPAKVGDNFEVDIDSVIGASNYKAKVKGTVFQQHLFSYPTCDFTKERLDIKYE